MPLVGGVRRVKEMLKTTSIGALALSACAGAAFGQSFPLPVRFGAPSVLEIGPAPLPSSVEFNLAWPTGGAGAPLTDHVTLALQASEHPATVLPSPSDGAIVTKGHGGGPYNRIVPTGGLSGSPFRDVTFDGLAVVSSGPTAYVTQHYLALWTDLDNDGALERSSQRLLIELEISVFQGVQLAATPRFTLLPDGSLDIFTSLTTPPGVVIDPSLDVTSYRLSAQVIPAPGVAAVLGLGGLLAARRRRR
jgi:hypothetical protein